MIENRTGRALTSSEREWLEVRAYLVDHRYELGQAAAGEYPDLPKAAGSPLLTRTEWTPSQPLPLEALELQFRPGAPIGYPKADSVLPVRPDGSRYPSYSAAVAELAAPTVFENRTTYRLHEAELTETRPRLVFGRGRYFDGLDTGEAAAHEHAASRLGQPAAHLRPAIPDPCDLASRPANLAISTLTLCVDSPTDASFLLHWRDPAKVGHAGGLYQVIPVGIFQPSSDSPADELNDFSLQRCMIREYAEELLGEPEDHGEHGSPIDYHAWPFARSMIEALDRGDARAFVLGLGVDPLTFATDLLTAVALPRRLFAELFGNPVIHNAEGRLVQNASGTGFPFTTESVRRLTGTEPMQAAGAALLRLALHHARILLDQLGHPPAVR